MPNKKKKSWIYGGVVIGVIVSIVLAVLVKLLFKSGTFGNNNFLILGWTGVFAAVMLIYVSYWLHSNSSVSSCNHNIEDKSSKSLANGSLFSLGFSTFLAVFREGTEVVLRKGFNYLLVLFRKHYEFHVAFLHLNENPIT